MLLGSCKIIIPCFLRNLLKTKKVMKRFLLCVCLAFFATPFSLFSAQDGPVTDIVIVRDGSGTPVIHRSIGVVPIKCCYNQNALLATFQENLGLIIVEIENQTTGEFSQTTVYAEACPMVFAFSGTNGLWRVSFILTNGDRFSGEFVI